MPAHPRIPSVWFGTGRLLLALCMLLTGCVSTPPNHYSTITTLPSPAGDAPHVVVMPLDVELSILSASGLQEPQAEWTQNAIGHMTTNLPQHMAPLAVDFYAPVEHESEQLLQMQRLHEAVGMSIMIHQLGMLPLPSKKGRAAGWTLGPTAAEIKRVTHADYALFVLVRDSYASGGRVGMAIAMSIIGVGVPLGQQIGFASLVDLDTGDVVWFNRLFSATGDLRTAEAANKTVAQLLSGMPGTTAR